jgi:agmatine/peptidylarginine deiminase
MTRTARFHCPAPALRGGARTLLFAVALCVTSIARADDPSPDDVIAAHEVSPGKLSPFAHYFRPGTDGVVVSPLYQSSRRQRGDWEPIDLLVLVHNPEWERALRFMVERARTRVPVQVLMPVEHQSTSDFRAWSKTRCVGLSEVKLNTPWIRDYGPLQVFDGSAVTWLDYAYYPDRRLDDRLPGGLGDLFQVPVQSEVPHVDGGGLVSNGRGLCAMTDTSLADAGMHLQTRAEIERFVAEMGCNGLAVLPSLPEEQTGHADVIAQFLAPDVVAVADMNGDGEAAAQNAELLDLAVGALRRTASALGQELHVVRVPMHASGAVFYSYLNVVRVRDLLFVPDYSEVDATLQADAHQRLHDALPGVSLVPVPADTMVSLGGAIHCITLGLNTRNVAAQPACTPEAHAAPATLVRRRPAPLARTPL